MPTEDNVTRKLRAILSADVKGYSLLMSDDEAFTVETLKSYRKVMSAQIGRHKGRVVDAPGDNLLAEFASAVDAVQCAVEIQKILKERNEALPEKKRLEFRIGVNIGDVIQDGDSLYGEGVNIAARIEGLAEPGGVCISRNAYDHISNKLNYGYEYLGERSVKNIEKPVRVYKVLMASEDAGKLIGDVPKPVAKNWIWATIVLAVIMITAVVWQIYQKMDEPEFEPASIEKMVYPLPDKLSIAVLPFDNMSSNPEYEHFSDGLSEEIITALSIVPELHVIARNSSFTYKGKPVKVQQVSEELGVQYVLEGSVRKSGDMIRITAQLIDALKGHHLWAETYDRNFEELFDLQEEISLKIITELRVELTNNETTRFAVPCSENIRAYRKYMTARDHFRRLNMEDFAVAQRLYKEAIELDPGYACAYSALGGTHYASVRFGISKSPTQSLATAKELVEKAINLNPDLAGPYGVLSHILRVIGEHDKSFEAAEKSIALSPNSEFGNGAMGYILMYAGRSEEAIVYFEKVNRLDPFSNLYLAPLGLAYFFSGRYQKAIEVCESAKGLRPKDPTSQACLVSAYSAAGNKEEAQAIASDYLEIYPTFSMEQFSKGFVRQFKKQADIELFIGSIRKAGIPEKPPTTDQPKPSIAVLPFDNLSDDPEQGYLADGLTDELIGDLAKIKDIFVISRNSTFTYKGKDIKIPDVAKELNVRYVLEGSVQRAGNKLRIRAQLIDGKTDHHMWAESYDGVMDDIFKLQDEITSEIVTAVRANFDTGGVGLSKKKETQNVKAYEYFLKGWNHYLRTTKEDFLKAIKLYHKALELDPEYYRVYAALALVHREGVGFWLDSLAGLSGTNKNLALANKYLKKAVKDPTAIAYAVSSRLFLDKRQYDEAISQAGKGISLNYSELSVRFSLVKALIYSGQPKKALPQIEEILWLDPINPARAYIAFGLANYSLGNLQTAYEYIEKAKKHNPSIGCSIRAVVYADKGMKKEAAITTTECQPLIYDNIDERMWEHPFKDKELAQKFANGLHSAGIPGEASGYKKIYDEYKLSENEIKNLIINKKYRVFAKFGNIWILSFSDNNVCTYTGLQPTEKGRYWFENDSIWLDMPKRFYGEQIQASVYKNPDGTSDVGNLYFFVSSFGVFPFSLEE